MGLPRFDPREAKARLRERERHAKSKTLRANAKPMKAEPQIGIPEFIEQREGQRQ
jgi:hypothetical protein